MSPLTADQRETINEYERIGQLVCENYSDDSLYEDLWDLYYEVIDIVNEVDTGALADDDFVLQDWIYDAIEYTDGVNEMFDRLFPAKETA